MLSSTTAQLIRTSIVGDLLLVTIDHPPVNSINVDVRAGLVEAINLAEKDPKIKGVLLLGAGRTFIAGADIKEFGKPAMSPILPHVCERIEMCDKPVIAIIHGLALGGGLEIALSSHYRLAMPDAKFGLPEVQLGLIPGAGGTQRAPRLMGVEKALDLILGGRQLDASEAFKCGLVDAIADGNDNLKAGLDYAHTLLANNALVRRTRDLVPFEANIDSDLALLEKKRIEVEKNSRGLFSPLKAIDAVKAGLTSGFDEGLKRERELFLECMASPQRAGLIHAFFAEREVLKVPEIKNVHPRSLEAIGVVGGGTMGAGIAISILDAGLSVTLIERDADAVARGRLNVEKVYDNLIMKGRMTNESKTEIMSRFNASTDYGALSNVDLVVEAVFEDMQVKKSVFSELDRVCKPNAVLATNTSYLDINEIASSIKRPQDVIGLHFFSPANIMKLLEIVVPNKVDADVVATAFDLAKKLKKVPVRAGVCDGFIGNRILAVYRAAVDHMMEDGCSPYEIDEALRDFGYPMGPFQVSDLAGGDIGWATRKRRASSRDPKARYVQIPDRLCERGWFGQKTQRGYYKYPEGARQGVPDPEVLEIIDAERIRAKIKPASLSKEQIVRKFMAAMINEGANVVHEGIALRPLDVDVVYLYGYGFPRYRGGPMKYADCYGLENVLADIQEYAIQDPLFWQASPLLIQLVRDGKNFDSLNSK